MASSALIDDLLKQFAENPRRVFARLANEYRKRGDLDIGHRDLSRARAAAADVHQRLHRVGPGAVRDGTTRRSAHARSRRHSRSIPRISSRCVSSATLRGRSGDLSGARGWYHALLEVDPQNDEVEAVLREIDAPAAVPAAQETVSWNDINPEATPAPAPVAPTPISHERAAGAKGARLRLRRVVGVRRSPVETGRAASAR